MSDRTIGKIIAGVFLGFFLAMIGTSLYWLGAADAIRNSQVSYDNRGMINISYRGHDYMHLVEWY